MNGRISGPGVKGRGDLYINLATNNHDNRTLAPDHEALLLLQFSEGDKEAFATLYRYYQPVFKA